MLDSSSNPFREYRQRDSMDRFDDARGILLRQLQEHPLTGLDPAIVARVKKARLRHAYLEIDAVEDDEHPLWYAVQFGVNLPAKLTTLEEIDLETNNVVSFDEEQAWQRLAALGLPYRRGTAAILTNRGFRSVCHISENVERKEGVTSAMAYLEEHVEALHELYRRIVRGTTREE